MPLLPQRSPFSYPSPIEINLEFAQLYKLNKDVIGDNPNLIRPGMRLILPEDANA